MARSKSPVRKRSASRKVRLKPADSFDLIRLLATSQHDPRKAVCELVQNSLDAQARNIELTWFTHQGLRALTIRDDGRGIFPELSREDALRKIATTIGHSHKRSLNPVERRELMLLGKYGIGLLGFWCVGKTMEIKTRVAGSEIRCLRLQEGKEQAEIRRVTSSKLIEIESFTEVTISHLHEAAARQVRPGRLRSYLASELRGQLLSREVELSIRDRVARGLAPKFFVIQPERFLGEPVEDLTRLEVPGHEEARLELYFLSSQEEHRGRVALCCNGTRVLDDLALIDGEDTARAPWSSGRIEGILEFPELDVAPGTRRGFRPTPASLALLSALPALESELQRRLGEADRQIEEKKSLDVAKRIRKAFAPILRSLPDYDLFDVRQGGPNPSGASGPAATSEGEPLRADPDQERATAESGTAPDKDLWIPDPDPPSDPSLIPAGPLDRVTIVPGRSKLPPGSERRLRARALDADGRRIPEETEVEFDWSLQGDGEVRPAGFLATYVAPAFETEAEIEVMARQGDRSASCVAGVRVLEDLRGPGNSTGIPEPLAVHAPSESWRSRLRNGKWEFNSAHRDYVAVSETEAERVRYLIRLFAKELVLRNFGGPAEEAVLERMVEVLTWVGKR